MLTLLGELFFIIGLTFQYWALLSPVPWGTHDPNTSMLRFTPYNEPPGYVAPNPCPSSPLSNSTVHFTIEGRSDAPSSRFDLGTVRVLERSGNAANYSNVAIWLGPLGSCSRDQDNKVYCTKPSFSSPQYNLTYVQPNSVFYPDMINDVIDRKRMLGTVILNTIIFVLYVLSSLPYLFPILIDSWLHLEAPSAMMLLLIVLSGLSAIAQFFVNFGVHVGKVSTYNSIDNFYEPAPCGTPRELKAGILLRADTGKMYSVFWTGWVLIFVIAHLFLLFRIGFLNDKYPAYVRESRETKSLSDVEKAAKKEAKKEAELRSKVETEKERIREIARREVEEELESNSVKKGSDAASTGSAPPAPPYVPLPELKL